MSIVVWQHGTSGGQVRENLRVRDMEKKVTKLQLTNEQLAAELNQETPCIPVLFRNNLCLILTLDYLLASITSILYFIWL